jgi:hypothetical protein
MVFFNISINISHLSYTILGLYKNTCFLLTAFIRASNIRWCNRTKSCRKWKYLDRFLEKTLCFTRLGSICHLKADFLSKTAIVISKPRMEKLMKAYKNMAGDMVCFNSERRVWYWKLVRRKSKQNNKEHVVQRQIIKLTKNIDHYRPAVCTKNHACRFVVLLIHMDTILVIHVLFIGVSYKTVGAFSIMFTHELYCNYRKTYASHFFS